MVAVERRVAKYAQKSSQSSCRVIAGIVGQAVDVAVIRVGKTKWLRVVIREVALDRSVLVGVKSACDRIKSTDQHRNRHC